MGRGDDGGRDASRLASHGSGVRRTPRGHRGHVVLEPLELGRGWGLDPTATIFVQNFKYNGVPTTVTSGVNEFLFQNQESFPITHEMIPIQLPAGKTAQDVIDDAKANGPIRKTTGCTSGATSVPSTRVPASSRSSTCHRATTCSRAGRRGRSPAATTALRTLPRAWSRNSP